jgi:hypothetical protein
VGPCERYAHLEQHYLGAETRKLSLIPQLRTRHRRGKRRLQGAANAGAETSVIPFPSTRAADGIRTRDPELGKLVLYQLSYHR